MLKAVGWSIAAVVTVIAYLFGVGYARGQEFGDFGVGHAEYHHWYETGENGGPLMRPDMPGGRCCTDDGRPAKSKYVDGNWWVYIDGRWEKVPPQRVKTDVEQPNNTAHVFASKRQHGMAPTIYCFIPPRLDG